MQRPALDPFLDDDRIDQCLQELTETQTHIRDRVVALAEEKEKFEVEMARKVSDLERAEDIHKQRVDAAKRGLVEERQEFEETKKASEYVVGDGKTHIVKLDVGGDNFSTDIRTLQRQSDSIFPRLVENLDDRRSSTYVFIDRDSKHFRFILNFMRQGEEVFRCTALRGKDAHDLEEMICEARYYRLNRFKKLLERHRVRLLQKVPATFPNLVSKKCFKSPSPQIQLYETANQLLFKGLNMEGIAFEKVHFRHRVSFEGSLLAGAKFKNCRFDAIVDFTDADISGVSFDHCVHATPDRFVMDGTLAAKLMVTFNPPVNLKHFSLTYTAQ